MIRCLAVDDEEYATGILADYILKVPFLELAGTTSNALEALALVQQGDIDLVFLDIQMPELTGIQFLKLCGNKCKVILTTAYPQYALDGYEHDVIDYLLKPIEFERFIKAAQKALHSILSATNIKVADNAAVQPETTPATEQDYMFVKGDNKNKFLKIDFDRILYIEGLKNYVSIYTEQQKIVTYLSLNNLETRLPTPPFYRVHKSFIISINKIRVIDGNLIRIKDIDIPIGNSYKEPFFKMVKSS